MHPFHTRNTDKHIWKKYYNKTTVKPDSGDRTCRRGGQHRNYYSGAPSQRCPDRTPKDTNQSVVTDPRAGHRSVTATKRHRGSSTREDRQPPCPAGMQQSERIGIQQKLDESTAYRHLKSPQSLSGRSLHLTLVTKWPKSHMTFKIQILIQGHGQGQTHWSYLRPRVQINMFAFRFVAIGPVLVEIYKNSYFTLKIQGQGHSQGQI